MNNELIEKLFGTLWFAGELFIQLAVLFVAISFIVGILNEWLPAEKTRHYLSARSGRGYLIGALIGSATPFCSCSTVPLTLGLLKSGAGFGPTMTLLFTSPLVNPIIVTLFWVTFGFELTILYTAMALSMSIGMSWLMDRAGFEAYLKSDLIERPACATQNESTSCCGTQEEVQSSAGSCSGGAQADKGTLVASAASQSCCSGSDSSIGQSCSSSPEIKTELVIESAGAGVVSASRDSLGPLLEKGSRLFREAVKLFVSFLPHIVIGVMIGAFAHGFVPDEWLVKYAGSESFWAIPLAAIIGVPLYVRGSTMIPIAMTLTAKGMGIGAVIALVIGGAGASLPEMVMLKRMFHWPILLAFLLSVFGIAITTGFLAAWMF